MKMFKMLAIFILPLYLWAVVVADYRMDECYWMDNAGGVMNDVKELNNSLHGTSHGVAQTYVNTLLNPTKVCMASKFTATGDFVDVPNNLLLNTTNTFSFSAWVKPQNFTTGLFRIIMYKTTNYVDGFTFYIYRAGTTFYFVFLVGNGVNNQLSYGIFTPNQWWHVVGTYDGATIRMYLNGVLSVAQPYTGGILNANSPLVMGMGLGGLYQYLGEMDEVKLYNHTLTPAEVNATYTNELAGKNYDGTLRTCPTCDTNVTAGIWSFVGIPADLRTDPNNTIANVFDEFNASSYNVPANADGWVVFQRDYNATNNASSYSVVPYMGTPMKFGQGYWLISKVNNTWSENNLTSVDYNSTNPACVTNSCVEINLTPVNLNFGAPAFDPNDGSGKNRNNMLGFVGHTPVNWKDCRILINGTAYTPSAAAAAGYMSNQVWQYNPGVGGANANGYTTCSDISVGGCKLEPYKGFWVILYGKTKGTTVKLLIPKG